MITPLRAMLAGAALGVLAACTNPFELCGCTLVPPDLVITGTVTTAAGAPVAGATIHARIMEPSCSESPVVAAPLPDQRPATGADGRYSVHFSQVYSTPDQCVRIVAHRAPGDSAFSAAIVFRPVYERGAQVPQTIDVVFP
jgi:hypothetical protein